MKHLLLTLLIFCATSLQAADQLEFMNGTKVTGTLVTFDNKAKQLTFDFTFNGQKLKRTFTYAQIHALTWKGKRHTITAKTAPANPANPAARPVRTQAQVDALIAAAAQPPPWLASTRLTYPRSLDMRWPRKANDKDWNNQKYIGHYVWDVINPNPGKWREGIKFMHHVVDSNRNNAAVRNKATNQLAALYASLLGDWARAAYWWRQTSRFTSGGMGEGGFRMGMDTGLARAYWELGNKQMAEAQLRKVQANTGAAHLLAEMGEHDRAITMVSRVFNRMPSTILVAGDICRYSGKFDEAKKYYERAANDKDPKRDWLRKGGRERLANLAAARAVDLSRVRNGTFSGTTTGYSGPLTVSVTVSNGRITASRVTRHVEKQFYSALTDVTTGIIAKQGVKGVDATTSATITSEAIISATAKALVSGSR